MGEGPLAYLRRRFFPCRRQRTAVPRRTLRQFFPALAAGIRSLAWSLPMAAAVTAICFLGQPSLRMHVAPGQVLKSPILSEVAFSYESAIQTQQLRERKALRIAPVYKLEMEQFQQFSQRITQLAVDIDALDERLREEEDGETLQLQLATFVGTVNQRLGFSIAEQDLQAILLHSTASSRRYLWNEALDALRVVVADGIVDSALQAPAAGQKNYFMNLDLTSEADKKNLRTQEEALLYLRIQLGSLDERRELASALFHIFRSGVAPNLTYDREKTDEKKTLARSLVKPVQVSVEVGEVVVGSGTAVGSLEVEKLYAYRQELRRHSGTILGVDHALWRDFLLTFLTLQCAVAILRALPLPGPRPLREGLAFATVLLLGNLLALRGTALLWETHRFASHGLLFHALPYLTPLLAGVTVVALLLGPCIGTAFALLLDIFFTLMIGKNLDFFLVLLLGMLLAVGQCRSAIFKGQILRIGTVSGLALGLAALAATFLDAQDWSIGLAKLGAAVASGLANGILASILLGPLERIFLLTGNIRLQELSDFNHRLLRQLQLHAPGTYHHSLMVASLAERAAKEVGANWLICRVAALFHDIGKITKPNYFIENQMAENPHREKAPRISALIIKSHVRNGMDVAGAAGIPPRIIQVMREHHGTTLIQYFYDLARQQAEQRQAGGDEVPAAESGAVEESFYRYDGPKPRTLESAILMLVDSCEAASRSLHKITAQSVGDLVDAIFQTKIGDGQLDDCPITFLQLHTLHDCIVTSLLNSLHSRISYVPQTGGDG
ncbi:MAG: HDIG domain-containing protein [Puniceicoccales bacterium]|jgi:putative nucleotidyltransferase with HDIG domain|nr:HDIG domain-containing protein [Puniceicoccales bacterium]